MMLLKKFFSSVRIEGLAPSLKKVLKFALYRFGSLGKIERRRHELSKSIGDQHNNTVAYGIFSGMKLDSEVWWGKGNRASMILGMYELEVLNEISKVPPKCNIFINVGAADGYYGIGSVYCNKFEKSYCFEISPLGQKIIKSNAKRNEVEDKVFVFGEADSNFYKNIPPDELQRSVLLCDIEGGEFSLFNREVFYSLRSSIIIVEIHDFVENSERLLKKLIKDASEFFNIREFCTGFRNPSEFVELKDLSDDDRWLICSEGRPNLMRWLVLEPK